MTDPDRRRLDGDDRPERERVYDDEITGPRPGRDIKFRETGDRDLKPPKRRAVVAYSSDAMRACYDAVEAAMPSAQLSGIYTDKPGYHNCRNKLPSSDYSVQRSWDKKGDAGAGGGIDITLSMPTSRRRRSG